ncbi:zinc-ribbon domain-containing protein [Frigoribacterium sp. ACAM 257]|uniref:zinc-ribbon domain-containing protein n=1 Tax=Frigoribacterium sp. ACAM 257 TaxID=2508998 RepID=UPI0011BA34B1|nr:zinc-ribbon domain-containing protein [Frigoribacterium sp. ACAM 257]TWX39957.1 zinc-ribbon domain-containing protein [Frigoribacterium sp. ACAM 257]
MFLLFGTSVRQALLTVVVFACRFCGRTVEQQVARRSTRFTLFFVPLFTVSKRYHVQCTNCGGVTDLTREQAEHSQDRAARQG